ncbi:hypothetical protein AVEN_273723-1, partial [Araneus ventricosus]
MLLRVRSCMRFMIADVVLAPWGSNMSDSAPF